MSLLSSVFAAEIGPKLQEALEGDAQSFDVVIKLKEKLNGKKIRRAVRKSLRGNNNIREEVINRLKSRSERAQRSIRRLLAKLTPEEGRYLWAVNSVSLELSREAITEVAAHPKVEEIELNVIQQFIEPDAVKSKKFKKRSGKRELFVSQKANKRNKRGKRGKRGKRNKRNKRNRNNQGSDSVSGLAVNEALPGFDNFSFYGREVTQSDDVNNILGITGKGVVVAVLDTGIQQNHSEFANPAKDINGNNIPRFVQGASFINNEPNELEDLNNHGTHCAGTVAGSTVGVAPDAQLMAVKVLAGNGSGGGIGIIQGIQFAAANGADVISMSLGSPQDFPGVDGLERAVNNAVASGAVVVVAAGNSGSNASTLGSPGSAEDCISVGAHDSRGALASFSSRGPNADGLARPDLTAPGVGVRSAIANGGFAFFNGTSMATPHVAGISALMLELLKPAEANGFVIPDNLTRTAFLKQIFTRPENVFGQAIPNQTGAGSINAFLSVSELATLVQPEPEPEPVAEPQESDFTQEKLLNDLVVVLREVLSPLSRTLQSRFRFRLNSATEINIEERTAVVRLRVERFVVVGGRFVRRIRNLTLNFTLELSNPEAPIEEAIFTWVLDEQSNQALQDIVNI